ncbi:Peroxidase 9 [Hibiscus syriacus]|uniref:peroxidase n=1 Tax=Hibiscus syriacus TaxID=106335 RepID=A0A6A3BAS1_HIBSY|nr:Peroxidase 9 [Hibiscus syriacus]
MSLCFCSLISPSPLVYEANFPWNLNLNRSSGLPHNNNRGIVARVTQRGYEVGSVSFQSPIIEAEEKEEVVDKNVNGVVVTEPVEDTPKPVRFRKKRDEDDDSDDESFEDRFKLRNGKEVFEEKAYLVGVERKGEISDSFAIEESLKELAQLADTAGLMVVGSTYQKLASPNPRTYIGSGKVAEIKSAIRAFEVETVIFDDELSPGQLRNLEKAFGGDVRVCDRNALILDIFNQRDATHEAALQATGGKVKGMGEKQIEVDKRILRTQIGVLKKELESVRKHRKQYRNHQFSVPVPVPVVSLSTLLYHLTGANVLSEDRLFATLDPTTRRVQMKNGSEFLLTDTVGFIQKLPTTLVAAFRATLEEISEPSLLVHVVDISHPLAEQQIDAVEKVLAELNVSEIPKLMVWNKVDRVSDPQKLKLEAERREDVVCISAVTGEGLQEFFNAVQEKLKDSMVPVEALLPFDEGELLSTIHQVGMVEKTEYTENGTFVKAFVPLRFARLLTPMRQLCKGSGKPEALPPLHFQMLTVHATKRNVKTNGHSLDCSWPAFLSATVFLAHPGLGFGWGIGGSPGGQFGASPLGLFPQFYQFSCPQADDIVMSVLKKAVAKQPRMAASLLRLHFHDCFVQVTCFFLFFIKQTICLEKAVMLDDSATIASEKNALPNRNSIRGFEVIDEIKAKLEEACPQTVSCADIRAMDARGSTVLSGGPSWELPLGRRDSKTASLSSSNADIPPPHSTLQNQITLFKRQGLLNSDQVLLTGNVGNTMELVKAYAEDDKLFFKQFGKSMIKMGNSSPLTGFNGELRKYCRVVN